MMAMTNNPNSNNNNNKTTTSPTLSSLLNNKSIEKVDTPMKDYLPTPVTPASDFSQLHTTSHYHIKKDANVSFSKFSVIKPPVTFNPSASAPAVAAIASSPTTPSSPADTHTPTTNDTTSTQKPYPCPECHQTFSRPHNLKSHLTTHSSERPFQCDVCNHHFRRHHDLKRHQKLHTGERPYVCKDCYRSFARLDALSRHRRAEGGTACSAVHQQVKQQDNNMDIVKGNATSSYRTHHKNTNGSSSSSIPTQAMQQQQSPPLPSVANTTAATPPSPTTTTTTVQRPVIPQLHIPHPASHLYPKKSNSNYNSPSSNIPLSHSPPPANKPPLLPSPSALSTLPIANNNNLTPIYSPAAGTPSSPPTKHHNKSPLYHPYQQPWSPYRTSNDRLTLPPLSSPPAAAGNSPPMTTTTTTSKQNGLVERLIQENEDLKRDINQLRAMAQKDTSALKFRVHDLEVENKVLRSLIHNPVSSSTTSSIASSSGVAPIASTIKYEDTSISSHPSSHTNSP